jgi:hypothetical protein
MCAGISGDTRTWCAHRRFAQGRLADGLAFTDPTTFFRCIKPSEERLPGSVFDYFIFGEKLGRFFGGDLA